VARVVKAHVSRVGHGGAPFTQTPGPLVDHGGPVQTDPVEYFVFWGTGSADDATVRQAAIQVALDLPGSSWNQILTQYGVHNNVRIGGVWLDHVAPPQGIVSALAPITFTQVAAEANRALVINGWPRSINTQIVVMPQAGSAIQDPDSSGSYCAYHDYKWGDQWSAGFAYSLIPSDADPFFHLNCLGSLTSIGASTQRKYLHEYAEIATDPQINAYYANNNPVGGEIGDLCYLMPATIGSDTAQGLWDNSMLNSQNSCATSGPNGPVDQAATKPITRVVGSPLRAKGTATLSSKYSFTTVQVAASSSGIKLPGGKRYRMRSCLETVSPSGTTSVSCTDKEVGKPKRRSSLVARTPVNHVTLQRPMPAGSAVLGWSDVYVPQGGKWQLALESAPAELALQ
jgi:hypothetical protein